MSSAHIGLIGCGRWGRNILRDLLALGCSVTVADPDAQARAQAERAGARVLPDASAIPPADGYVVASPTSQHVVCIRQVLGRRRPIFVEKPLSSDPSAARSLLGQGADIYVMDKWRYHPGVQALRTIAASGELGRVVGLKTTRVQWGQPHHDVDAIWILAPHDLSIGKEVLGSIPDLRSCVLERYQGAAQGLLAVFGDYPWFVVDVSACRLGARREIRLVCEQGIATLEEALADHITIVRGATGSAPRSEPRSIETHMPLYRELEVFVGYLNGGPPPLSSLGEAVATVELIARMRRTAGEEA
jgi:predicted dehydrogenase